MGDLPGSEPDLEDLTAEIEESEEELEQQLHAYFQPGFYAQGEELCLEILESVDPNYEPARLFYLLYLAAQDAEEEALSVIDDLQDDSLFEALRLLAFGEGTEAEQVVYEDIMLCLQERGLEDELTKYLSSPVLPLLRLEASPIPESWRRTPGAKK